VRNYYNESFRSKSSFVSFEFFLWGDILRYLEDNVAQISAEMIIVLAALLAVAIILVTKLSSTSKQAADKVDEKTTSLLEKVDDMN